MTVSSSATVIQYAGNGSSFSFPINTFNFWELEVVLVEADGTETIWDEGTEYSIVSSSGALFGDGNTGTLNVFTGGPDYTPLTGETLRITRKSEMVQETDWVDGDPFPASSIENAVDRLTMIVQELYARISRAPLMSEADAQDFPAGFVLPTPEASKHLAWDATGSFLENADAGSGSGSGDLLSTNNLSDLADASAALTNLGLSANGKSLVTAADYSAMRTLLGLVIGTNVQAYDADLDTWAGITPSANAQALVGAANYAAMRALLDLEVGTDFPALVHTHTVSQLSDASANGRSLISAADYSAMRTLLGLVIGTNVQAAGATLTSLEGLSLVSGDILYATGADTLARLPKGTDGQYLRLDGGLPDWETIAGGGDMLGANNLSDLANAATARTNLGLSANGSSLVTAANYAAMRALLDLEIGTDLQAYSADLDAIAGAGNWKIFYTNGTGVPTELALGASGTILTSNGASNAPAFSAPAAGGYTYLGQIAASSGSSASLGSLSLTNYKFLRLVWNAVSSSNAASFLIGNSTSDDVTCTQALSLQAYSITGIMDIDLSTGVGAMNAVSNLIGAATAFSSALSTATTTISVAPSAGNFDASGTIDVYAI